MCAFKSLISPGTSSSHNIVFLLITFQSDDPLVLRTCYPAMRHTEGDIIRTRDCVLLKANEENELPYVAKVAHLWENPEDGESSSFIHLLINFSISKMDKFYN